MSSDTYSELVKIFRLVKTTFRFRKDNVESWTMPPSNYNGRQSLRDDCDGFCLACRKLLRDKNIPSRLVYCEVDDFNESFGHLVVEVDGWILDNRQNSVKSNARFFGYRWLRISGFQPGDEWREITNTDA